MPIYLLRLTLFVSAFLLFWCQPMVAKMVLPLLGGSASVWTTCLLFFQTMLLAGYVYAHGLSRLADIRKQLLIHGILTLGAIGFIPISFFVHAGADVAQHPLRWLLIHLAAAVGVPFFVLSATAPLVQNWLARTDVESRQDPYFLYAASNAGSLLSLVLYPLVMEPMFGLQVQSRAWSAGYGVLLALLVLTGAAVLRNNRGVTQSPAIAPPDWKNRRFWAAAAFVPSALLLAVTTHISVNIAPVPFLWIIPLAVYLLTFIMAFGRGSTRLPGAVSLSRFSPLVFVALLLIVPDMAPQTPTLNWLLMGGHVAAFFFGALLCHRRLAERRPPAEHLTEFYFWIALGGALGGTFTALIAPVIFKSVFEYPLLVAVLAFFRESEEQNANRWDWILPAFLGALFLGVWQLHTSSVVPDAGFFIALLAFRRRRLRFALAFAILIIGYALTLPAYVERGRRVYIARNFFGVKKVLVDDEQHLLKLIHGEILHGIESTEPERAGIPLSYYHPTGPVGDVMAALGERPGQTVGVVGLGSGSLAAYASASRQLVFYEIDTQVETIARQYFSFLDRCREHCSVAIGDGRLAIERTPDRTFDLILLDAFSSDSIPAHLVSREALRIYQSRLKPNGMILFHVSNRYLNVGRLVSAVTGDAGLVVYLRSDREDNGLPGKSGSDYAVAARHVSDLGVLPLKGTWFPLESASAVRPWTDDYSNVLDLLRWKE